MSKTKSIIFLTLISVLVLVMGFFTFAQFPMKNPIKGKVYDYKGFFGSIERGIDLEGGFCVVMTPKENVASQEDYDAVIEAIEQRLEDAGYSEYSITRQNTGEGSDSLRIEIPDDGNSDIDDIMQLVGNQGLLTFQNDNHVYLEGNEDIISASVGFDENGNYCINLEFTPQGQKKFYNATNEIKDKSDNKLYIYVGEKLVSNPTVSTAISGNAIITGNFTQQEAQTIASIIKSGALSINFDISEAREMSATLGDDVVNKAVMAAGIGILIIFAILILFYGGMGIAASIALMFYVCLYVIVLWAFPWVQLTLPGIAGIILSIGMAVDANVVIFDRVKEEYNNGKTVTSAITYGFRRAIVTVLDSNVTTILAAIVLWILCSGSIKGFAITLFLGTLISLLSAIFVTRLLINVLRPLAKDEERFLNLTRRDA